MSQPTPYTLAQRPQQTQKEQKKTEPTTHHPTQADDAQQTLGRPLVHPLMQAPAQ